MSFRSRLTLFFILIVIVPMVSVAVVLFSLISDNETGKADARIAARQDAAIGLATDAQRRADEAALAIGSDPALAAAVRDRDAGDVRRELARLRRREEATRVLFTAPGFAVDVGARKLGVFPAVRNLDDEGRRVGRLDVAITDAVAYAKLVRRVTELEVVVRREGEVLAATLDGSGRADLPEPRSEISVADVELPDGTYRAATFTAPGFERTRLEVTLLEPAEATASDISDSRLLAGGILAGFFVLAFAFAVLVSRSLQRQIDGFLDAARRLGAGDFTAQVPTSGRDEFAALGDEFNKMAVLLEARLQELQQERIRLQVALRQVGEAFASNLDRDGLLEVVVSTTVDGIGADGGRATARRTTEGPLEEIARAGAAGDEMGEAARAAEREVLRTGLAAEASRDGAIALAHPLRAVQGEEGPVAGVVSVWRGDRPFSATERELFHYLAAQAAVSVENVGLHEVVERQAVTDELTGLANRRRFQEALEREVERSRRFGGDVGLVLLDIDDFKKVNDTYGHQQGDLVLREVARILRETSREIDEPARYGGEELAVVLPGTDLEGAYNLAERVREGIEALELAIQGDEGTLQVTASFGVAAIPTSAEDLRSLVAAADEALYDAKRAGKNRSVRAA